MVNNPIDTTKIDGFIRKYGESNCYIGITASIKERFMAHKLIGSKKNKTNPKVDWYWGDAETEEKARAIEEDYKNRFDELKGNPGGGKNPTKVYIYLIIPGVTDEDA